MDVISEAAIKIDLVSFASWLFRLIEREYPNLKWSQYPSYLLEPEIDPWELALEYRIVLSFRRSALHESRASQGEIHLNLTRYDDTGAIHCSMLCSKSMDASYPSKLASDIKDHWRDELIAEATVFSLEEKAMAVLKRLYSKVQHNTETAISVYELKGVNTTDADSLQARDYLIHEGWAKPGRTLSGQPTIRIAHGGIKMLEAGVPKGGKRGDYIMGDKIKVTLGDNATIQGSFTVVNSIQNSFNKAKDATMDDDLKGLLTDLSIAIVRMIEDLSEEEGQRAARALQIIIDEATKENPDQKWWQVSVDGLTEAAENVGKVGKPVLDIVKQLVPILLTVSS